MSRFEIPYFHSYISESLAGQILQSATDVEGIPGLRQVGCGGGLETTAALRFMVQLYDHLKPQLAAILQSRIVDRDFIDRNVRRLFQENLAANRDFSDVSYETVIGLKDAKGRVVVGPHGDHYHQPGGTPVAPVPQFMQGPHVTLFGPPDSAKMAINAMNAYHRKLKGEPPIVEELLRRLDDICPTWGADDEDSKTPLRQDLIDAAVNLTACFDGSLVFEEPSSGRRYELAKDHLSSPMKRFPGLALPSTFLFWHGNPIPLHLYDFALHLFHNAHNPRALVFYVPKLENEEEAAYVHAMIATAEGMLQKQRPAYVAGSVRVMVVLENPRAILRTHEIVDALHPFFIGASLGWHDFLAATARLFKGDANYRIPVKADPDIVIKYIKASHELLATVVGSRGGIKVGGMYGILPQQTEIESPSFQVTLRGFFKDVITQLRRDLTGFWVAHPDFVRLGIAIVSGWKAFKNGEPEPLTKLIDSMLMPQYASEVRRLATSNDVESLDESDPLYVRSLLVADIKESDFIANNHPDEVRYNVFQTLQYLADWLRGNGCVALPTTIEGIPVRVMDDLATAERSRWEVWHEIYHQRFSRDEFLKIVNEEYDFIVNDRSDQRKMVQVKYDDQTRKWYPVARRITVLLMTQSNPVEFATEFLMPFTIPWVRDHRDPWLLLHGLDPDKYPVNSSFDCA